MESASLRTKINQILFLFKSRPRFGCAAALQSTDNGNVRHCVSLPSAEYKKARQEIKKKSSDTLKLQKKAKKGRVTLRMPGVGCGLLTTGTRTYNFEAKSDFGGGERKLKC